MTNLNKANPGDKFELENGDIVTFVARTKWNSICETETGYARVYDHDGCADEYDTNGDIDDNFDIIKEIK